MDERLTQIIPAQPGYRLVIIDHYNDSPSWSMTPVTAWGLVCDDEHDLENRPGHWEGVVALWPHDDPGFPALTWERDDARYTKVWFMLGPGDPDPTAADITEEWRRRHEGWRQELQSKTPPPHWPTNARSATTTVGSLPKPRPESGNSNAKPGQTRDQPLSRRCRLPARGAARTSPCR